MVNKALLTLGAAVLITHGFLGFMHYSQEAERVAMKEGVQRDIERQKRRKGSKEKNENELDDSKIITIDYKSS